MCANSIVRFKSSAKKPIYLNKPSKYKMKTIYNSTCLKVSNANTIKDINHQTGEVKDSPTIFNRVFRYYARPSTLPNCLFLSYFFPGSEAFGTTLFQTQTNKIKKYNRLIEIQTLLLKWFSCFF